MSTALHAPTLVLYRAQGFGQRLAGVWRRSLGANEGLWLLPCKGVHTLGLRQELDVVFLCRQGNVLHHVPQLAPNRCVWHGAAYSVVELPGGYCRLHADWRHALRAALAAVD